MPALRVAASPSWGRRNTRTPPNPSAIVADSSSEPSSTTMTSMAASVSCASRLVRHSARKRAPLNTGTTTEIEVTPRSVRLPARAARHAGALAPGHELGRHLAARPVAYLVTEHNRAAPVAFRRRLLVGLEDVERVVELLLRGREHLVDHRNLARVQRPLAVVP